MVSIPKHGTATRRYQHGDCDYHQYLSIEYIRCDIFARYPVSWDNYHLGSILPVRFPDRVLHIWRQAVSDLTLFTVTTYQVIMMFSTFDHTVLARGGRAYHVVQYERQHHSIKYTQSEPQHQSLLTTTTNTDERKNLSHDLL
jgi:hypothetical protein